MPVRAVCSLSRTQLYRRKKNQIVMPRLVRFELESGGSVVVELEDRTEDGEVRVSRPGFVETAKQKFGQALDMVRPVADTLIARLRDLAQRPDEVQVEFGIKLSTEAGAIIAKTEAEGSFKVTLTWKTSPPTGLPAKP